MRPRRRAAERAAPPTDASRSTRDDRRASYRTTATTSQPGDRVLLIVEDDLTFAPILLDLAREKGFKGLVADPRRRRPGAGAAAIKPDAITLDIDLPDIDGWTVLDRLKHDPATRHIPVHIISVDRRAAARHAARRDGVSRPSRSTREALDEAFDAIARASSTARCRTCWSSRTTTSQRNSIVELIGNGDVKTTAVATGEEALAALEAQHVRLHGARPRPARHERASSCSSRCRPSPALSQMPDHRLHRQGADRRQRRPSCGGWPRRSSSRTSSRRSGCSTRPRCSCTASRPTCREPKRQMLEQLHQHRSGAGRQEGAGRRRRHPQHLRADQRPRAARDGGALRRERQGRHRDARRDTRTSTSC